MVYAKRVRRKEPWLLRLCYFVFYRMMARLSDIQLPLDSGDFGLMSRRVVDHLRRMPEHHRYLRGMRTWVGFRQIGIEVERAERHSGKSKYNLMRLLKLAFDGIFAFSIVPIRVAAIFGAFVMFLSMLFVAVRGVRASVSARIAARVHLTVSGSDVPFRHRAIFPGGDWGIRRADLRGHQGTAALRDRA